ncbi:MAG: DMT family transporter [Limnospira sp.]
MKVLNSIPGRGYLLLAILIFAAANSVTRKLTELGAQYPIDGRNSISFCNVLLVGNIWAFIILMLLNYREVSWPVIRQFSKKDWLGLTAVAFLSGALAPALFFGALERTMVNNVILIGRIEPPLTLALSIWLLHERVNRWVVAGAIVSFLGVAAIFLIPQTTGSGMMAGGFQVGIGELMTLVGAIAAAFGTIVSKISLGNVSLGFFSLYRTALGTVIFLVLVIYLFGLQHFTDVFAPLVWQWMFLYSAVIVVGGQFFWFMGLKRSDASEVSLANSFSPVAGVLAAYLILGEVPTAAQYIGGAIIIVGIILNQIGISQPPTPQPHRVKPGDSVAAIPAQSAENPDRSVGFKGV